MRKVVLSILCLIFLACKKDPKPTAVVEEPEVTGSSAGSVNFLFNLKVNGSNFVSNKKWYKNSVGENFTVTKLNYYISNIKLTDNTGKVFSETESYHLIKHLDTLTSFEIRALPAGTYNKIEFMIGVDSLRNVSGAQTGALDPKNIMFWEWNSGYIFLKLEGLRSSATVSEQEYAMHIGGFKGKYSSIQKRTFTLSNPVIPHTSQNSKIYFDVDLDQFFQSTNSIAIDNFYTLYGDSMNNKISQSYKNMFVLNRIEN